MSIVKAIVAGSKLVKGRVSKTKWKKLSLTLMHYSHGQSYASISHSLPPVHNTIYLDPYL